MGGAVTDPTCPLHPACPTQTVPTSHRVHSRGTPLHTVTAPTLMMLLTGPMDAFSLAALHQDSTRDRVTVTAPAAGRGASL